MRSFACAECGTVRWDSSLRCPECGSATTLPEAPTGVVPAPSSARRRRVLDVAWREVPESATRRPARHRQTVEIAIALAIVGVLAAVVFVYDVPHIASPGPGAGAAPQVVIGNGKTWPVANGDIVTYYNFTAARAGTLTGGFQVFNGTAEICVSTFVASPSSAGDAASSEQCPSDAIYSTGFVSSGHISVPVPAGLSWLTCYPGLGANENTGLWNVTWSPALEIVPS